MFDTAKIQQMMNELISFAQEREDFYFVTETVTKDALALFRRLKMNVRAIIFDETTNYEQVSGIPIVTTAQASKNFNERTGLIVLVKKALPVIQTEMTFDVDNRRLNVPTFVLSPDEILAIYDRLIMTETLRLYHADGLSISTSNDIAVHFARGLKTFLSTTQTFKFQLLGKDRFKFRYDFSDTAIVVQGPIVYENNYTADTLKFYRTIYPNAPIVVSTWTNEATDEFRKICRENSVALLENKPPDFAGSFNVNMQLESSLQGVKFIRQNTDAKFVLKCRTDQRINKSDFLTWFRNLILTFSPFGDKLRGRILLADAVKWLPFRTSDFIAFGYVDDIAKLYGISRHGAEISPIAYRKNNDLRFLKILIMTKQCKMFNHTPAKNGKLVRTINNISRRMHEVETHILKTFYEENIGAIDYNKFLETGWKFMRDYLVIVGVSEIRLDWPKYEEKLPTYNVDGWFSNEIDFARWLNLCRNFNSFGLE